MGCYEAESSCICRRISSIVLLMKRKMENGCQDYWGWDTTDKSTDVKVRGSNLRSAYFHPNWSNGTAAIRATHDVRQGRSYWEISVSRRLFGTSMMFGVGTRQARVHADAFINIIGEDCQGWGLSHKGLLWHDGKCREYTKPFSENMETTVGILFDGLAGTLTFFKDGVDLGPAFTGLDSIDEPLFPMVSSTAARTEMSLVTLRRDFISLQDRCRNIILREVADLAHLEEINIPKRLKHFICEGRQKNHQLQNDLPWKTKKRNHYEQLALALVA